MTIEHRDIQTGEQHVVANWVVSSVNALTSLTPNELDIGKQAWVAGRGHYVLAAVSPNVWELVAPTVASAAFDADTRGLTLTLTDSTTITVTVPPGVDTAGVNALIAAALEDYYTASEIDGQFTALSEAINTALNGKEPAIAAGTSSQYWRGDKTWKTLDADAVAETASRVYLSPAQKTVATQAATSLLNGYLSGTDWATFNGKQAALADVITANTYGSSTQYPIVTVNAKGIVTGITLQTMPTPTFTDATFAVRKNGSPSISATWSLAAFTTSHVHTYPNKDINFGNMSSVATTDSNTLSGTRTRIVGGSGNNVSGTDNVAIGCTSVTSSSSTGQLLLGVRGTAVPIDWPTEGIQGGTLNNASPATSQLTEVRTALRADDIGSTPVVLTTDGAAPTAANTPKAAMVYGADIHGGANHIIELQIFCIDTSIFFSPQGNVARTHRISVFLANSTYTVAIDAGSSVVAGTGYTISVTAAVVSGRLRVSLSHSSGADKFLRAKAMLRSHYNYIQ